MSKKTTGILIGLAAAGAIAAGTAAVIKYISNKDKDTTDFDDDFEDLDDVEESRNYVNIPLDNEEGSVAEDIKDMAEDAADACCEKAEDIADACCEKAENVKESIKDVVDDIEDTLDDITE